MTTVIVTMQHVRAEMLCTRGARAWAARQGLDWSRFLREGIEVQRLESIGDAFALRLCVRARREANRG